MRRVGGGYVLADCDSTNGIRMDDDLMEVIDLKDGEDYEIGDVLFNYTLSEEEQEALADEKFRKHQKKKLPKKQTPPAAAPAAFPRPGAPVVVNQQSGARDFAIFLAFALLAAGAFWLGLADSHRSATKTEDARYGRSLWADSFGKEK